MKRIIINQRGITLIALIVTIIVLIILAGISINLLLGNNGIIAKAQQGANVYGNEEKKEKLSLMYQEYLIDEVSLRKNETFLEYLDENGYDVDYEDAQLKDGIVIIDTKKYRVETLAGLKIEYVGEASQDELNRPKFTNVNAIVEDTSAQVIVALKESQGVTLTYSIKKESDVSEGVEQSGNTFNNLEQSTTYIVTVKAVNDYGEKVKKVVIRTKGLAELTEGKARFVLSATTKWQSSVNVTIDTTFSGDENIKLQYKIGEEGDYINYPVGGFTLRENGNIYGRYYDLITNEIGYTFSVENIDIIDSVDPEDAVITLSAISADVGQTITAEVTHSDLQTQIAIANCKYIVDTSSEKLGKDAQDWNNAIAFGENPQTISITQSTGGTYYLHVLSIDEAGNKKETVSNSLRFIESTILLTYNREQGFTKGQGRIQSPSSTRFEVINHGTSYIICLTPINISEVEKIELAPASFYGSWTPADVVTFGVGQSVDDIVMDVKKQESLPKNANKTVNLILTKEDLEGLEGNYYIKLTLKDNYGATAVGAHTNNPIHFKVYR